MGLRVLSGHRLGFSQRRAGFVALASDVDEDGGVAAVWVVRHPGSPDSAQHTLEFERGEGWRFRGSGGSSAREFSLDRRPSAAVNGPVSMMRLVSSSASRSWTDRDKQAAGLGWPVLDGWRARGSAWLPKWGTFKLASGRSPFRVMAMSLWRGGHHPR
jgi:hypothetical protein